MSFNSRSIGFMHAYLRLGAAAFILVCALSSAHSIYGQSMPGFQAPNKPKALDTTPLSVKAERGQAPLSLLYGHLVMDAKKVRRLPALDPSLQKRILNEKLLRVGVVRPLQLPLNPLTDSTAYSVAEGEVNVSAVTTEGALYTRVHFKNMALPPGARVFVYSASNPDEYHGPYEGHGASSDGTFWTPLLTGDTVVIEYVTAPGTKSKGTPFQVSEVSHTFKDSLSPNLPAGACNNDVSTQPQWLNLAKSVGMLDFIDDETDPDTGNRFEVKCTGTLLNDTASDQIPYVLTANHCVDSQTEAQSVIVFWNYNQAGANDPPAGTPTTFGSNLLATGTSSDFSLLRLTGSLPGGLFFSGWNANPLSSPPVSVTGIHHPMGSHKRISSGATNGICANGLPGGVCGNYTGVTWSSGVTEPGSSGSGIWIGQPDGVNDENDVRLVGTLTGGDSSCADRGASDFYGRFSVTYPNISPFLNNCVTSINPGSQNFSNAAGAGNITVSPNGCSWSAVSSEPFVHITSTSGTTLSFSVDANPGWTRSASITVGSKIFIINQARSGSTACTPTPINVGQTLSGRTLTLSDCDLGDNTRLDAYTFNGVAGQLVAISMTSSDFDTYLYLLNPDGSTLVENDDTATSTNSRIPLNDFFTMPATGTYTILANAFRQPFSNDPVPTGTYSLTLSALPPPLIFTEESNAPNAFAVDSVTFVRGPFRTFAPNNFSGDQHTRVLLYTSDLGLTAPNPALLTVQANGVPLTVENVGPITGVAGLSGSYVVVRLPNGLPTGTLTLTFTSRGQTSNATTINIIP
jgi:hypothetical protein